MCDGQRVSRQMVVAHNCVDACIGRCGQRIEIFGATIQRDDEGAS